MSTEATLEPERTLVGQTDAEPVPHAERAPGALVDRYVITGQLGAGAMGVVYRAHDPSLDRVVALKLLHPAKRIDAKRSARLLGEAQALAKLSGPNVVSVFDVGTVGDELYIAMEFVEGQTLSTWMRTATRSPAALIDVFAQAARGLALAHDAGLVHGDFKPANVMVDGSGRAKVLDFGLAQQADLLEATATSLDGERDEEPPRLVGTPCYMAPELLEGRPGTARTDQFAFCVAMWEALYGVRPFAGATIIQLTASVLTGEPREPGSKRKVPRWLHRALLRGLARDPAQRWDSMEGLRGELLRDRTGPRRLATIGAVAAMALAGFGWSRAQPSEAQRCASAADDAIGEWGESRIEALETAILASNEPYAETTAATVRGQLTSYLKEWDAAYVAACAAPAAMMSDVARERAYRCLVVRRGQLGALVEVLSRDEAEAAKVGVEAVAALESISSCGDDAYLEGLGSAPEDPALADAIAGERERLATVEANLRVGQLDAAYEGATAVVQRAEALGHGPFIAEAHSTLGRTLVALGRYDEARTSLRLAYQTGVTERAPGASSAAALALIGLERMAGDPEQAREWAFQAEGLLRRPGTPERLWGNFHSSVGQVEGAEQNVDEAISHLQAAVESAERTRGSEHWVTASRKAALGSQLQRKGDGEGARMLQAEALETLTQTLGAEHPRVGIVQNNLALVLMKLGETEAAIEHLTSALAVLQRALPPGHPNVAYALTNLSSLHLDRGDEELALEFCGRALRQREGALDADHLHIGYTLVDYGDILRRMGRYEESAAALERAHEIALAQGDPTHVNVAASLVGLGRTKTAMGAATDAVVLLERGVAMYDRPRNEYGSAERSIAEMALAEALWVSELDRPRASQLAREVIDDLERAPAASNGVLARDLERWKRLFRGSER